ncbi:hypothetical protein C5Y96_05725 [Blastopirellula marina]|uniref:Uncharacterized protein n=1 Tax=Blastopirellula marina TaxID=124 RepID=A0A2S8G4L0_9BACT|nr:MULTISPECIES: hypothetical protein [Pirellulaceae]PQO39353.1 hypothetical protein C5Y96_05725 [Blastopirellula marina]RCS55661.1 hypothetical protein DTL36_05735 [Bremerella cremea]
MADNAEQIAELEALQNLGATSVSVDGMSASVSQEWIARRLRELRAADDNQADQRPIASTIDLSGA